MSKREYTGELYDYLYSEIKGELVFDVGAHVGKLTKNFINAGANVVAVEPQIELTNNVNFFNVMAIENVCVSDKIEQIVFYKCDRSNISTCCSDWIKIHSNAKWEEIVLPGLTLDKLVEKYGIPLYIKIDVEGFEDRVLAGLSHKIKFISFEYTRDLMRQFTKCIKEIHRLGFSYLVGYKKIKYTNVNDGEFTNLTDLITYFNNLPERSQGDLLIINE